ncbi:Integral membrane protein TerC [Methylocella silvestris BL2]|uniref:Integral membrane protein TerC n=2 Tax=Methylocella silvestris TaxID=199596 RepID=B8ETC1_METSB|nr:Integral membrane protein TerC [Methylocella silvestris BL2]
MACHSLPQRQRRWAIFLGAVTAAALRIVFTLLVLQVLAIPYVRLSGGVVLLWIAIRLVGKDKPEEIASPESIYRAIRIIVIADAVMSLDNIIAIAGAAQGSWPLIIFGLGLSIPIVIFGATLLVPALNRFPALIWAGAGILGWVAGELIGSDPAVAEFLRARAPAVASWHLAAAGAAVALFCGWLRVRIESSNESATV